MLPGPHLKYLRDWPQCICDSQSLALPLGAVLLLAYLLANSLSGFNLSHLLEGFVSDPLPLISKKRQSVKLQLASQAWDCQQLYLGICFLSEWTPLWGNTLQPLVNAGHEPSDKLGLPLFLISPKTKYKAPDDQVQSTFTLASVHFFIRMGSSLGKWLLRCWVILHCVVCPLMKVQEYLVCPWHRSDGLEGILGNFSHFLPRLFYFTAKEGFYIAFCFLCSKKTLSVSRCVPFC